MATLREVLQAVIDGRGDRVEHHGSEGWHRFSKTWNLLEYLSSDCTVYGELCNPDDWRVLDAPKPKKRVKWDRSDVPPLCWLRHRGSEMWSMVTDICDEGVWCGEDLWSWSEMMSNSEYSTTLEECSWRGCFVEVEG